VTAVFVDRRWKKTNYVYLCRFNKICHVYCIRFEGQYLFRISECVWTPLSLH